MKPLRFLLPASFLCAVLCSAQEPKAPASQAQRTASRPEATRPETEKETSAEEPAQPSSRAPQTPEQVLRPLPPQPGTQQLAGEAQSMRFDMTEVPPVQTHHQIMLGGRPLRYTSTAGRLPIKNAEGRIEAEMFFAAYTADGAEASTRPLTFAYNGGPGAASIWLHMGALGPKVIAMQPEGWLPEAPYRFVDNQNTPLDRTDLVLVDAIGTGYSRPADSAVARKFENPDGDIEAFSEFIRLYLSRYDRWSSPLYLFGESYGTTRSAGVAGYMASRGVNFNGVVLLSMVLNFETLLFARTNDVPYPLILPSFTAIAAYHHKLPPELGENLEHTLQEVKKWASTDYVLALQKGDAMSVEERQNVVDRLARYTGLSKEVINQANLRIDVRTFTHYLLGDQLLRVGRLDGRYTAPDPDGFMEPNFTDPASSATEPPFTMAFNDYVRRELKYRVDLPYYVYGQWSGLFQWNRGTPAPGLFAPGYQDTATPLREALVKNPYLKVLVMEGYYDLATPFFAADYTIDHLNLPASYRKNISFATYTSGHMVYLDQRAHAKLKKDFSNFIDATTVRK